MGGFTVHRNGKPANTLALGLDIAIFAKRGFEHERAAGAAGQHTHVGGRRPAADFLVAVDEHQRRCWGVEIEIS